MFLDVKTFQGSITIKSLEFNVKFISKASIERLAMVEIIENKVRLINMKTN